MKKVIASLAIVTLAVACDKGMRPYEAEKAVFHDQGVQNQNLIDTTNKASLKYIDDDVIALAVDIYVNQEGEEPEMISMEFEKDLGEQIHSRHIFAVYSKDDSGYAEFLCMNYCRNIYVIVKESSSSEASALGAYVFQKYESMYEKISEWTLQTEQTSDLLENIHNVEEFLAVQMEVSQRYPNLGLEVANEDAEAVLSAEVAKVEATEGQSGGGFLQKTSDKTTKKQDPSVGYPQRNSEADEEPRAGFTTTVKAAPTTERTLMSPLPKNSETPLSIFTTTSDERKNAKQDLSVGYPQRNSEADEEPRAGFTTTVKAATVRVSNTPRARTLNPLQGQSGGGFLQKASEADKGPRAGFTTTSETSKRKNEKQDLSVGYPQRNSEADEEPRAGFTTTSETSKRKNEKQDRNGGYPLSK